jgi:hypothetical protein
MKDNQKAYNKDAVMYVILIFYISKWSFFCY